MKVQPRLLLPSLLIFIVLIAACGPRPTPTPPPATPTAVVEELTPEPTATTGPTPTPPPTAPQIIDTEPARGAELAPDQPLAITFDRPLDENSVQLAFEPALAGETTVQGAKVLFQPAQFSYGQRFTLQLQASANGYDTGPLRLPVQMQGYLQVANTTPADANENVGAAAPLTIAFNRPVVPLGPAGDDPSLPQPLTLDPPAAGKGAWLNTSIYQFQPDPPLLAGTSYVASVAGVTDLSGSPLEATYTFSFTTDLPVVVSVLPEGNLAPPSSPITVTFSAPMDAASTEAALSVTANGEEVAGASRWSDDGRVLSFRPDGDLPLGARVEVGVSTDALAAGGAGSLRRSHSHNFGVAPFPAIIRTQPKDGDQNASLEDPVQFVFNAPILPDSIDISLSPPISATQVYSFYNEYETTFYLFFPRRALSDYTVTLAAGVKDPYGNAIAQPTTIRFRTGERRPELTLVTPGVIGAFDAYTETAVIFQSINVAQINAELYRMTPDQVANLDPQDDYDRWRNYRPAANQLIRRWTIQPDGPRNERVMTREVLLDQNGELLGPGLYYLRAESPQVNYGEYDTKPSVILVVSHYNVIIKRGRDDGLVWVTDLASGKPVADLPVTIYPWAGQPVSGRTDAEGVFEADLPVSAEPWRSTEAFMGPEDDPGWASTTASASIAAWDFSIPGELYLQPYRIHLYTDRPLYRAGDTIHFRGIIRADNDAVYSLPANLTVDVILRNPRGDVILEQTLPTDAFGAIHSDAALAAEAELGIYTLELKAGENNSAWVYVMVAAFRKPEYTVEAAASPAEVVATQPATATVQAAYYFGGAVKNAPVRWTVYSGSYTFAYEGGWSFSDYQPSAEPGPFTPTFRQPIASGLGQTDDQGRFSLDVPTDLAAEPGRTPGGSETRTIEFAITDISDQEVAGNTALVVHAAGVYAGVRPQSYVGQAGSPQTAEFIAVDALSRQPQPGQTIEAVVNLVTWRTVREKDKVGATRFVTKVDEQKVSEGTVTTGADGQAALRWTPAEPGQYLIRGVIRDELGNASRSAAFVWVAGDEYAFWPVQNNDRIELVADKKLYEVGETAQVLVPSPWQGQTTALITIERAGVFSHEVRTLATNSETLAIPIRPDYAPTVYVSVVLVAPPVGGDAPTFKLGYAQINVDPEQHLLDLSISASPNPARPGDAVTYQIQATDHEGKPVRAQLSLALVDKALLALLPDAAPGIEQTFWATRGLGVQTGVTLVASLNRVDEAQRKGAKGGGGGGEAAMAQFDVRSDFRDLAFWQADAETGDDGRLEVTVTLPDNLTTWQMAAVAATGETQVADETHELLVTKPLLIRPVLPRFVVHNDRFRAGAIVQNNTGADQTVTLTFALTGLTAQGDTTYRLEIPDGGLARVDLPVQVDDIDPTSRLVMDNVTVQMAAVAGGYTDAVEIALPVRRYSSPETVATAGIVTADEPRYEAITLPDRYDPTQGDLTVRVEPSLAAGMTAGLDYLEHYPYECTEQTVSRFLPNVFTAQALAGLGLDRPELKAKLDEQIPLGLQQLYTRQNPDGGWGWFAREQSNPYTSGYVLFGLTAAQSGGYAVDAAVMARGATYLRRQLSAPDKLQGYKLNQQAFFVFVLDRYAQVAGTERPLAEAQLLFEERERLAHYAAGYLALTLHAQAEVADTASQSQALLDAITGQALTSATGAHWEEAATDWWTMNTDTRSTAVILSALVAIQPDHPLGPNVVRWLMSARTADTWQTTHETAWALIALTDWMVATGELQGGYSWDASLNGQPLGNAAVAPDNVDEAVILHAAIGDPSTGSGQGLLANQINTLLIERTAGPNLYYSAYLRTFLPVADLQPLSRGLSIARRYTLNGDESHTEIKTANVGDVIDVELTLVVPTTMHYLLVEDPIPAGTEPVDTSFATTSQSASGPEVEKGSEGGQQPGSEPVPYWWWLPTSFQLKDDRVAMFATELLPGSYTFRYQLRASIAGEFNVLPPRGEMMYFPEVFGHGAGSAFTVTRP